jgi:hypothetical protein
MRRVEKVISGGQTGADRGGLEAARALGIPTGGTAPKGYLTENGPDDALRELGLVESQRSDYAVRTKQNVKDSDGTLAFRLNRGRGTDLTIRFATAHGKPVFVVEPKDVIPSLPQRIRDWIGQHGIRVLNVAGNRESISPGIQQQVFEILTEALQDG